MPTRPSASILQATLGLSVLLYAFDAQAHARLLKSDPATDAKVSAPKLIHLQFSETLAKKFSSFRLSDAEGHAVALTAVDSKDPKVLEAAPVAALAPGRYTISWTSAASDDGHRMTGHYSFTVQ